MPMYKIMGRYKNQKPEVYCTAFDLHEATQLVFEYMMAHGPDFTVWYEKL